MTVVTFIAGLALGTLFSTQIKAGYAWAHIQFNRVTGRSEK